MACSSVDNYGGTRRHDPEDINLCSRRRSVLDLSNYLWRRNSATHSQDQNFWSRDPSCCVLWLFFGRWRKRVFPNHGVLPYLRNLHGVMYQKAVIFIVTAIGTSNSRLVVAHVKILCSYSVCACKSTIYEVKKTQCFRPSVRPSVCDLVSATELLVEFT